MKRTFHLVHQQARMRAALSVSAAPDGYTVTISEPTRNLEQNALMWVYLDAFSKQLQWPVNGKLTRLTPEEWKAVLTSAFFQEAARVAMGINGGMVMLGVSTRSLGKREFAELIEFIQAVAADRGVELNDACAA